MRQLSKILFILGVCSSILWSQEVKDGSLSVLVFSNGKPLADNEVKVDSQRTFKTDSDGAMQIRLSVGSHQIEIFGKDSMGVNLGYFKKQVRIERSKDTQVIATLSKHGADSIDIDTPVKMEEQADVVVEKSTGTGTLQGRVLSSQDNKPIVGARVFVHGTSVDTRTNENGNFKVSVPAGKSLSISVVHSAYSAQTVGSIRVVANHVTSKTIQLTPASMELEEFVVLAPKIEGSITDIIQEEKQINAIANIIGSEEFSKKGDSSAASALKRVTGVTLIGGKSIYVRGLGERYSNVELNSMPLSSPDPTKRVVPLDIFPSSMIGSMKVQKSGTADIPATFGGGYIDLRSKDTHDEDYTKVSLGLKANSNTGSDVIGYQGGGVDFLAFDDGYRAIPDTILNHASVNVGERIGVFSSSSFSTSELMQLSRDFVKRDLSISKEALPVGGSVGIEGLRNYKVDDENEISVFASYKYSADHAYTHEDFYTYSYNSNRQKISEPTSTGLKEKASSKYSHAAMLNVNYNYLDVLKLKYTKLLTHIGEKNTRVTDGVFGSNNEHLIYSYLDWEERTLSADQLTGNFDYELFNRKNSFQFGLEYVAAILDQPNNFFYADKVRDNGDLVIDAASTNFLSRKLHSFDDTLALYLKNKTQYGFFSDEDTIEVGVNLSTKSRESQYQKFYLKNSGASVDQFNIRGGDIEGILDQYVRGDISYANRAFLISALFNPSDYYDATVNDNSIYVNMFAKPYENLEVTTGLKMVSLSQTISQYKEGSGRKIVTEDESLDILDFYPSLGVKYKYDENNHVDMGLSRTFIIPDLREFSSGIYFHPYDVATVQGNPDLVNTDIYSFDLKYSHYMNENEYYKIGTFFKYLDKPIEDTQLESSSLPIYSYINSDFAILYGVEFDGRKSLQFLEDVLSEGTPSYLGNLNQYFISGNISYTDSEVTLLPEQESILTTNFRQLQGLSQIVVNAAFGYESENRSVTLAYNKMGERIRKVGLINDLGVHYEDSIEEPPHLIDFVWIEGFGNNIKGKFKIGNLLDGKTVWKQGESITKEFKKGLTVSFGASYKF